LAEEMKVKNVTIKAHPFLSAFLTKGLISMRRKWGMKFKVSIKVVADTDYSFLQYKFFNPQGEPIDD
jgi:ribonuclease G